MDALINSIIILFGYMKTSVIKPFTITGYKHIAKYISMQAVGLSSGNLSGFDNVHVWLHGQLHSICGVLLIIRIYFVCFGTAKFWIGR